MNKTLASESSVSVQPLHIRGHEGKMWRTFELVCLIVSTIAVNQHKCPDIPDGFVSVSEVDSTILIDMRYAGSHNFVGRPVDGYVQPVCILTSQAATALKSAQREFMSMNQPYTLKLYDCYRPTMAVDHFLSWAEDLDDSVMRDEFYPDVDKGDIIPLGYVAKKSNHSRGSTVDLTIVPYPPQLEEEFHPDTVIRPCYASVPERFGDNSVDMGTGFDCFDSRANTDSPLVTQQQMQNRQLLHEVLECHGFYNYPVEWWHFSLYNEPYPGTYFNFPVSCNATESVGSPGLGDMGIII